MDKYTVDKEGNGKCFITITELKKYHIGGDIRHTALSILKASSAPIFLNENLELKPDNEQYEWSMDFLPDSNGYMYYWNIKDKDKKKGVLK